MRKIAKVLRIPNPENEQVGDNWLLATLGYGDTNEGGKIVGHDYYVVTDRVHASELGYYERCEVQNMAQALVDYVNADPEDMQVRRLQSRIDRALELLKSCGGPVPDALRAALLGTEEE